MSLFPPRNDGPDNGGEGAYTRPINDLPEGNPQRLALERSVDLIKKAHQIIKGAYMGDIQYANNAEQELRNELQRLGITNTVDADAIGSIILGMAMQTPPTAYGEDYRAW